MSRRGHLLASPNLQAARAALGVRTCRSCDAARWHIRHDPTPEAWQVVSDRIYAQLMTTNDEEESA